MKTPFWISFERLINSILHYYSFNLYKMQLIEINSAFMTHSSTSTYAISELFGS